MPGAMLERGFWLYIWRIKTGKGYVHYVGRTGDSGTPYAAPPYARMGQHLGYQHAAQLRNNLEKKKIIPEKCKQFELIAFGPIFSEVKSGKNREASMKRHKVPRDLIAALEKKLAEAMEEVGYDVVNTVKSRKPLDEKLWRKVHLAFAKHFPRLKKLK